MTLLSPKSVQRSEIFCSSVGDRGLEKNSSAILYRTELENRFNQIIDLYKEAQKCNIDISKDIPFLEGLMLRYFFSASEAMIESIRLLS